MIGSPPVGAGQLSPDGRWRWDGTSWVPAQPQRKSHRRFWLWTAAGCLTVLLLTAGGTGYWIYTLWQGLKTGATTCLPTNFPRYPGAKFADWSYDLNGPYGYCQASFETSDDVKAVAGYYAGKLNGGAWEVTLSDDSTSTVTFEAANGSPPYGTVQAGQKTTVTEITIHLYSAICQLWRFPDYPHVQFGGQATRADGYGCHVVYLTNDRPSSVIAFFRTQLNRGNWHVDSSTPSQVQFRLEHLVGKNRMRTDATGTVAIVNSPDDRTEFTVDSYP